MNDSPDHSGSARSMRTARIALLIASAAIVLASLWWFDKDLYLALRSPDPEKLDQRAWYQFLRNFGYLPLWACLALAMVLHSLSPRGPGQPLCWNGLRIVLSASVSAGIAEVLKPLIGRIRPNLTSGEHHYRTMPGLEHVSYGLPSSHAAVAFGGAFMVLMLYPRAAIVAVPLAIGCAWSRVLQGGHFPSDVFASAIIGYACATLLRPRHPS